MKKLLVVLTQLRHPHTGLWEVAYQLGRHLVQNIDFSEWEVTFLVPKHHPFTNPNVKYKRAFLFHKFLSKFWNYDVVHAIEQNNRYLRCKNKSARYITTIHDLNFLYESSGLQKERIQAKYQRNIKGYNHIVCISKYAHKDVLENLDIANTSTSVIYNGVAINRAIALQKPQHYTTKKEGCKRLLLISTFMRKKNIHSLVSMMPYLPDYDLFIVGKVVHQDYFQEVKCLIQEKKIGDRVHYLGTLTESEKHYCYSHCDAFVFPSIAEG
ncbi:MAG: glycosyltransferase, partial [Bacteroidales bacterium]